MGGKTDVALRGDHALKRAAGYAISAGGKETTSPNACRTTTEPAQSEPTFVRERLMALVAVLAAGEVAVVVAA